METTVMKPRGLNGGRTAASFVGNLNLAPVPQDPIASTGRRIRLIRERLGLSRPQFAELIGMKDTSLKNYELFFRAVDFDAVRNICEIFKSSRQSEIISYLALGDHIQVANVPDIGLHDLKDIRIEKRESGLRGVTADDHMLMRLVRMVREEAFGLSRPRFVEKVPGGMPPTTLKNYEQGYRRVSYEYARVLAELANNKVAGWKAIMAARSNTGIDITPWVKST